MALFVVPGLRHRVSRAKDAVALLRLSCARITRRCSARRRDRSICAGVTPVAPAPVRVPAADALAPFRSVGALSSNSFAATPAVSPSVIHTTTNFLNSALYCCLGIFIVSPFMVTSMILKTCITPPPPTDSAAA